MDRTLGPFEPVLPAAPPPVRPDAQSPVHDKASLRGALRQRALQHPITARRRHADTLARAVTQELASPLSSALGRPLLVGLYAPVPPEVDTRPLAHALLAAGHALAYPRMRREGGRPTVYMDFAQSAGPQALRPAAPRSRLLEPEGALVEPAALDVLVVPALGCDGALRRLGRGGGSYDRYLPALDGQLTVLALPADCVLNRVPTEPHDVAATVVCTEAGIFGPAA